MPPPAIAPPADGARNMAVDDWLLEQAVDRAAIVLRFYQWSEPTLSLGYFQHLADRDHHAASRSIPVVRRTTGGGALVHDRELTYSLVLPSSHPRTANPCCLYDLLHGTLIAALGELGVQAALYRDTAAAANSDPPGYEPFLCFQRRTAADVVIEGAKVAGSAQRRRGGAVLQHGSVLLARSAAAPELPGIRELAGRKVAPDELAQRWRRHIGQQLDGTLQSIGKMPPSGESIERLIADRYASPAWTARRP